MRAPTGRTETSHLSSTETTANTRRYQCLTASVRPDENRPGGSACGCQLATGESPLGSLFLVSSLAAERFPCHEGSSRSIGKVFGNIS